MTLIDLITSPDAATVCCNGVVARAGSDVTAHTAPTTTSVGTHASAY